MRRRSVKALSLFVLGGLYWQLVCQVMGVDEPWDAPAYWAFAYPASLVLAAIAGLLLRRDGWLAGAVLTFAQLPVMWVNNGTGPLWAVGLLFLCLLAIPAVALSTLTGWFASRVHRI